MTQKQDCRFVHLPGSGNRGGRTVAYLREKDRVVVGISYCHVNDSYDRKEGTNRAFSRVLDILKYGTNSTKGNVPVMRDATTQKITGFVLAGDVVKRLTTDALISGLGNVVVTTIDIALAGPEANVILNNMQKAIAIKELDTVSHLAVEAIIGSLLSKLR